MSSWILIMWMGRGLATATFGDYNSCYYALQHVQKAAPYIEGICVQQSGAKS